MNRYVKVTFTWGFWRPLVRGSGIFFLTAWLVAITCLPWAIGWVIGVFFWSTRCGFHHAREMGADVLELAIGENPND